VQVSINSEEREGERGRERERETWIRANGMAEEEGNKETHTQSAVNKEPWICTVH